ncbi:hypothetical protein G9P44_002719 [Scheffersomyces stipitis]|nr:hypothetical protein G9P44_002719 [Scheffersomyces stipitis]
MSESILQLWSTENVKLIIDTNSTSPQLARFASKLNYDVSIISSDTSNRCELKLLKPNPTYNLMIEPIQPLRDNLDSIVYSQFHKDFVKYEQYKRAIELALTDLDGTADILNILIVGPGEGGIVDKLIDILKIMSLKVKITAYEKNPKCTQILKDKNRSLWDNLVDIKIEDIRTSNLERQDLVISELLGSFGDNEACPEILSFFNIPENRPKIMIPESYTSYLQPVFTSLDPPSLQRPYLVHLTKFYPIDEPQEVWTFEHPSDSSSAQRSTNLKFRNTNIAKCISGFYGHFSATLYGHIQIQIESKSRYNFCNSWYPIFFPVSKTDLARDEVFNFEIARYSNSDQLWYEWNFKDKTYNKNGNTYVIDL